MKRTFRCDGQCHQLNVELNVLNAGFAITSFVGKDSVDCILSPENCITLGKLLLKYYKYYAK